MAVSAEYNRRYLEACDRELRIAERCGAHHLSNVKRVMAEMGVYCTGAGWLHLGGPQPTPDEEDDPETTQGGWWGD